MKLSIIVTTRNRKNNLARCVDSIKNSEIYCDWEIIIVDDNSSDETKSLSVGDFGLSNGKIIHNEKQEMMVRARNIGAKNSSGEYILFIDDDNVIGKKMIERLVEFADKNKSCGIVGPSMYFFNSKQKYLDYQKINFFTGKTTGHIDNSGRISNFSDGVPNVFLIKKEVFDRCGYFDESLIQTYTEPDFSFRASKHGYLCAILKSAETYHDVVVKNSFGVRVLGGEFSQKAYCLIRNRTIIISRYGHFIQKTVYVLFFSWFWPLAYSVVMIRHKRWDLIKLYWLGFIDGIVYLFNRKIRNPLT